MGCAPGSINFLPPTITVLVLGGTLEASICLGAFSSSSGSSGSVVCHWSSVPGCCVGSLASGAKSSLAPAAAPAPTRAPACGVDVISLLSASSAGGCASWSFGDAGTAALSIVVVSEAVSGPGIGSSSDAGAGCAVTGLFSNAAISSSGELAGKNLDSCCWLVSYCEEDRKYSMKTSNNATSMINLRRRTRPINGSIVRDIARCWG